MTTPDDALRTAVEVMDRLWSFGGWEVTQTHRSLRRYLVEETYEVLDAIDTGDPVELRQELGDLLLQVLFHSRIAEAAGEFTVDDVAATLVAKLAARSPHLNGNHTGPVDVDEQERAWERAKQAEKNRASCLDGIVTAQPSLVLADKILSRVHRAGLPADLIPTAMTTVHLTGAGDAEDTLRTVALRFSETVRATERAARAAGEPEPLDTDTWLKYWQGPDGAA